MEKLLERWLESATSTEYNPKRKQLREVVRKTLHGEVLPDLSIKIKKAVSLSSFSKVSEVVLETLKHHKAIRDVHKYTYGQDGKRSFKDTIGSLCWLAFQILDVGLSKTIYEFIVDEQEGHSRVPYLPLLDHVVKRNEIYRNIFLLLFQVMEQMVKGIVIVSPEERMRLLVHWLPALDVSRVGSLLTEEISVGFNSNIRKIISTLPLVESITVLEAYWDLKENSSSWLELLEAYYDWFERLGVQE